MANPVVGIRLSPELIEHYDILADQLGVERPDVMRAALETAMKANPIDDATRAAFRARPPKSKPRVTMGPDGVLKAVATDEVTRTYEMVQAMKAQGAGGASLAADGRDRRAVRRREGDSNPVCSVRAHRDVPNGRPAMRVRPDPTKRHLQAV